VFVNYEQGVLNDPTGKRVSSYKLEPFRKHYQRKETRDQEQKWLPLREVQFYCHDLYKQDQAK
jgi:hypothetical protein